MTKKNSEAVLVKSGAEFRKLILALGHMLHNAIEAEVMCDMMKTAFDANERGELSGNDSVKFESMMEKEGITREDFDKVSYEEVMDMFQNAVILACHEYKALSDNKKMKTFLFEAGEDDDDEMHKLKELYAKRMAELTEVMIRSGVKMEESEDGRMIPTEFKVWDYSEDEENSIDPFSIRSDEPDDSRFNDYLSNIAKGNE